MEEELQAIVDRYNQYMTERYNDYIRRAIAAEMGVPLVEEQETNSELTPAEGQKVENRIKSDCTCRPKHKKKKHKIKRKSKCRCRCNCKCKCKCKSRL